MDQAEALRKWLQRAYITGELTARLEGPIRRGKITVAEALGVLERVLEEADLVEAGPAPSAPPSS